MARPSRTAAPATRAAGGLPPAALALRTGLLTLLALRFAAMLIPGRALWGYDLGRDLAPLTFWLPFALTLLTFVPAVGERAARMVPRSSAALAWLALLGAAALAAFLWAHPDRALFNGDTSLRHGAFAVTAHPEQFAEQALHGDLVLHHALPRAIAAAFGTDPETANRLWGVLAALVSVFGAWLLARCSGARGVAAWAAIVVGVSTGALALFNGYGKSTVEIAVLTLFMACGLVWASAADSAVRRASGALLVALALAGALLLHRSALALIPAWLVALALAATGLRGANAQRTLGVALLALALLAPLAAWAVVGRELLRIVGSFDTAKHLHGGLGAALAFAATPRQLGDVLDALGILLPIAPLVPLLWFVGPRASTQETLAWLAFVLPPLVLLLLATPQHGLPRDWDVFTFVGVALAALAARRTAVLFESLPRAGALALPLALVALVPALQWVALQSDAARTWARGEAVLLGPPLRDATERAYAFDTIGTLSMGRGQAESAVRMFQRSAEAAPNPSTFVRWGMAETMLGRPVEAMAQYRHAAALNPDLPTAWRGIAAAASATQDRAAMEQAVRELTRLLPDDPTLGEARAWLATQDSLRRTSPAH